MGGSHGEEFNETHSRVGGIPFTAWLGKVRGSPYRLGGSLELERQGGIFLAQLKGRAFKATTTWLLQRQPSGDWLIKRQMWNLK